MRLNFLLLAAAFLPAISAAEPSTAVNNDSRIARVERGLLPPAVIAGAPVEPWSIAARMAYYAVPGVSIAVIDHGAIAWARGYGLARADRPVPVTPETLFQAGSISKPIAAATALALVESGRLALDEDVNHRLKSWKLPTVGVAAGEPVTLRRLLSHTAGLTAGNFAGYASDAPVPTLLQLLDGLPPANSPPVRIAFQPGTRWQYSDSGYCVVQQLLVDATGRDFPSLVRDLVLVPAGMTASTFAPPPPEALVPRDAAGHRADGTRLPGDAFNYPGLAADGLWSTPDDLARFALALQHSLAGRPGLFSRATAEAMLSSPLPGSDYGLGIGVKGEGENLLLSHSGANEGFRCLFLAYPRSGRGAVVMTNSDNGAPLANEIVRAIAREYHWPDFQVVEKTAVRLAPGAFDAFAGRYERDDIMYVVYRKEDHYYLRATGTPRVEIFPSSDHEFFLLNGSVTLSFERDNEGRVTHVIRRDPSPQVFRRVD